MENRNEKRKITLPLIFGLIALGVIIGLLIGVFAIPGKNGGSMKSFFVPYDSGLQTAVESGASRDYSCTAIHSAYMSYLNAYKKLESTLSRGTDKLAITVSPDGETMTILTAASVGVGVTQGDPMLVIYDDGNVIVGVGQHGASGANHSILQINRTTGLGFWAKVGNTLFDSGLVVSLRCI